MTQIHSIYELMEKAGKELQIIVIDSFYDAVNRDDALYWMGQLFRFKVDSYRESYPYGILPFSESDLVGTHWMLCEKTGSSRELLMAFKSIDSKRTEQFRLNFPALGIVNQPHLTSHQNAIQAELETCHVAGRGLGYLGSWTVRPDVKHNRALTILCRKICMAMVSLWVEQFDILAAVTFASLRFHVEKTHQYLGMTRLTARDGSILPDFRARAFFDEPACASILHRSNLSAAAKQDAKDCMYLWEKRQVIAPEESPVAFDVPAAAKVA